MKGWSNVIAAIADAMLQKEVNVYNAQFIRSKWYTRFSGKSKRFKANRRKGL